MFIMKSIQYHIIIVFTKAMNEDEPIRNPCVPSPCGLYSQCQIQGTSSSCSCLSQYIGTPPNCRPECVSNSECPYNLACINMKCKDPCPGACGENSLCRVFSHSPMCYCTHGYTGNPMVQCVIQQGN